MRAVRAVVAVALLLGPASTFPANRADPVRVNDNRAPAGALRDGVLTVRLDTRRVDWRPDGEDRPGLEVFAFGEDGGAAWIPGPLIRVREGTPIRVSVRNTIPGTTLTVVGFGGAADTLRIPDGEVRESSFIAGPPGTYFYVGSTASAAGPASALDSQLSGAFIVDPASASDEPRDRIFVLGLWSSRPDDLPTDTSLLRFVINGRPWPHTERLEYDEGDSIRWRVINTSTAVHPMHLHGFYYRVDSRGDGRSDDVYPAGASPRHVVTERLAPYTTMSLTWVPDRPGNWLFHCHDNLHILPINRQLDGSPAVPAHGADEHANHALSSMGGLVLGAYVRPHSVPTTEEPVERRRLRLIARVDSGSTEAEPAYAFALEEAGRPATGPSLPGPPIVLRRGEPVGITVVNELQEPTAVHWHGIELDSYYDGVAGFAGMPGHIAPAIAPRDSFEARFTPPRAGTFIYHTHVDETRQQRAGLSGALIVLTPGETLDPATDITVLLTTPRRDAEQRRILLNGQLEPAPLELEAGRRYRIRIINIHTYRPSMRVTVRQDTTLVQWRSLAKDGADLPVDRRTMGPAAVQPGNGETYDFELIPRAAGELRLDVVTGVGVPLAHMLLRVR